ncbi:hypothetical protein GNF76_26115 [Pseudomonas sp. CCM 7893]|uniref:Uncharacterized protein n=1 Tax=Pseudomonas spelaei TaxID=1055469 RepID=A0A6I3WC51_9PSED|nr:hypothetical protein [Pseudomonas spelaei]
MNPSSTTPAITHGIPIYPGATVRPLSIKPLINPGVLPLANDTIIHFPIHSGIAPVYVMRSEGAFNHKYEDLIIDDKIKKQFSSRRWSEEIIKEVVRNGPTGTSIDKRSASRTLDGVPRNDAATVYGVPPNGYIVVNDRTKEIVQIQIGQILAGQWTVVLFGVRSNGCY